MLQNFRIRIICKALSKNNLKTQPYRICVDRNNNVVSPAFIETELSEDDYDFVWYNGFNAISGNEIAGEFANNFTTSTTGFYSVKVTNTTNATLCTSVFNFRVLNTVIPFSITADPSSQITFESDASVTAIASPLSPDYQYAVDDSGWQSSNIFENINEGIHVLRVRNRFGCGEITTRLQLLIIQNSLRQMATVIMTLGMLEEELLSIFQTSISLTDMENYSKR